MNIPNNLTAGDSAQWDDEPFTFNGARYDSAGFSLSYELRGPSRLTVNAVANGTGWRSSIASVDSDELKPGTYWWSSVVMSAGTRLTVGSGQLVVLANLSAVAVDGFDGRTPAEKALADAEAALADLTGSGKKMKRYAIGSRSAEYYTAAELMTAINFWRVRVANEQTAKSIANGLGNPRNLLVRFR